MISIQLVDCNGTDETSSEKSREDSKFSPKIFIKGTIIRTYGTKIRTI